jgi:hypothetical protein
MEYSNLMGQTIVFNIYFKPIYYQIKYSTLAYFNPKYRKLILGGMMAMI